MTCAAWRKHRRVGEPGGILPGGRLELAVPEPGQGAEQVYVDAADVVRVRV